MRDDSSPPVTSQRSPFDSELTQRSPFDSELTRAMNDIPLPVGLVERLHSTLAQPPRSVDGVQQSPARDRWSRRLLLCSSVAIVLMAAWSWLGPLEAELTEADIQRLAVLDSTGLSATPPGTRFTLPAGWRSLPEVELAQHPLIANGDTLSIPVLPITFRASRGSSRATGLLLALPESRWPFRIDATSLTHTDVRYTASGTWAIWREGSVIFVCILHADARVLEALQHAAAISRDVS